MSKKTNATLYFADSDATFERWQIIHDDGCSRWRLKWCMLRSDRTQPLINLPCWDIWQASKSLKTAHKKMMRYSHKNRIDVVCLGRVNWSDFTEGL